MTYASRQEPAQQLQPEKRPHRQSRFVVPGFASLEHVQCAVCGARVPATNAWWNDGSPKYLGGILEYEDRNGYDGIAACRCHVGEAQHARMSVPYFDTIRRAARWISYPHPIIADLGQPGAPPKHLRDYHDAVARATNEMQRGELSGEEYEARLRDLLREVSPSYVPPAKPPTIEDILETPSLRERYFPTRLVPGVTA